MWKEGINNIVASSENVTDDVIKGYIKDQDLQENSNSDNFDIG